MRIFISVASPDRPRAEEVALALRGDGYQVFLDEHDLPVADSYHERIRRAIERADLMVYFISPASVEPKRYTLSELKFAQAKWQHPKGRVLPVMVSPTPMSDVPAYLKAVSICMPKGDLAAEVAFEVGRLSSMLAPPESAGLITRIFGGGQHEGRVAPGPPPSPVHPDNSHFIEPILPMAPMIMLATFLGLVSGLVTFMLLRGWSSDVTLWQLWSLTRGGVFAAVLCFILLFLELATARSILTAIAGALIAFLVSDFLLRTVFSHFDSTWSNGLAGAIRAALIVAALCWCFPELADRKYWLPIVIVSIVSRAFYSNIVPTLEMRALLWALWDAAFAAVFCYVLWKIGEARRSVTPRRLS